MYSSVVWGLLLWCAEEFSPSAYVVKNDPLQYLCVLVTGGRCFCSPSNLDKIQYI